VLIQNRFIDGDFAAAEHLSRDALAEYPDDGEFAWALITAQANRGDMDRAAASYRQLRPALINPGHVSLWLDLLGRRPVTDADVEAALDAAGQWPGTEQARRLIEGTVALIATAPASGSQLQTGVSAQNLRRLGVVIPAIPRGSQLAAASRSEQPHLPRLRVSGDALKLGAGDLAFDAAGAEQLFCLPHAAARPETAADPVRPAPAARYPARDRPAPTARPGIRSCAAHARHPGSPAPAPSSRRRRCLAAARPSRAPNWRERPARRTPA
jgi:hypothetical protein